MTEPAENLEIEPTPDGWVLAVVLPGVSQREVAVRASDRELHIEAVRANTVGDCESDFSYRLVLPADVDSERVEATMQADVLTVRLPRADRGRQPPPEPVVADRLDVDIVGEDQVLPRPDDGGPSS